MLSRKKVFGAALSAGLVLAAATPSAFAANISVEDLPEGSCVFDGTKPAAGWEEACAEQIETAKTAQRAGYEEALKNIVDNTKQEKTDAVRVAAGARTLNSAELVVNAAEITKQINSSATFASFSGATIEVKKEENTTLFDLSDEKKEELTASAVAAVHDLLGSGEADNLVLLFNQGIKKDITVGLLVKNPVSAAVKYPVYYQTAKSMGKITKVGEAKTINGPVSTLMPEYPFDIEASAVIVPNADMLLSAFNEENEDLSGRDLIGALNEQLSLIEKVRGESNDPVLDGVLSDVEKELRTQLDDARRSLLQNLHLTVRRTYMGHEIPGVIDEEVMLGFSGADVTYDLTRYVRDINIEDRTNAVYKFERVILPDDTSLIPDNDEAVTGIINSEITEFNGVVTIDYSLVEITADTEGTESELPESEQGASFEGELEYPDIDGVRDFGLSPEGEKGGNNPESGNVHSAKPSQPADIAEVKLSESGSATAGFVVASAALVALGSAAVAARRKLV